MQKAAQKLFPSAPQGLPYFLLAAAVFIAYANVYDNVFLFDDGLIILRNELLRSWQTFGRLFTATTIEGAHIPGGFYRPLQNIFYFFLYQTAGPEPWAFHLLNVALHAANAGLVCLLGRKLGFNLWAVFFTALIWALHPLHTEAITYISGTADPLYTLFCLMGLAVLLPDFTRRKFLLALPLFLLGLMSKENAVVFPLLVMSCMFLLKKDRLKPKTYINTWPLWLIAFAYIAWRVTAPHLDGPQSYDRLYDQHDYYNLKLYSQHFSYRVYTFLATLPAYAEILLWPVDLRMERGFAVFVSAWPPEVWIGTALLAAALAQIAWSRGQRGLALSWGLIWFSAAHFPNSGIFISMNSQFLEHWMYLPTIGLFLGIAQTLSDFLQKFKLPTLRYMAAACALIVAVALGARTYDQNMIWHDPFVFYKNIFKYGEVSARAHNNLALAYMERGDYAEAVREFYEAINITDTYPETRHNLALAILNLPNSETHIPQAIANLERSLEIDPNFYRAYTALAKIYAHTGDKKKEAYYLAKERELLGKPPSAEFPASN
ncbi:MAG: tetratricopeptide repeat protein [Alphaproteobacteria bacterium]|nr:tetratricopeptide repeat protein [Alphaproteobacteria bacterium]